MHAIIKEDAHVTAWAYLFACRVFQNLNGELVVSHAFFVIYRQGASWKLCQPLMTTKNYLDRLKAIDQLIRLRSTGRPEKFSTQLNISKRTLYNYINELKEIGLPISYSKELESYIYTTEGRFVAEFSTTNNSAISI